MLESGHRERVQPHCKCVAWRLESFEEWVCALHITGSVLVAPCVKRTLSLLKFTLKQLGHTALQPDDFLSDSC